METDRHLVLGNVPSHIVDQNVSTEQGINGPTCVSCPAIQIDDSDDEDFATETLETVPTDDSYGTNELAVQQSQTNEEHSIDQQDSIDSNFAVEMDQNDSTLAAENEHVLNFLDETTSASLIGGKSKTTRLNHKNPNIKRMTGTHVDQDEMTNESKKSPLKQSVPRKLKRLKRCNVCGIVCSTGNLSRHMRTHTGEKPHRCNRCARRFTTASSLMIHASTHIAEFPFHCRACFHGFSSKAEMVAHEKRCQKRHFECYFCKKYVTCTKYDLTRHLRIHSGEKPFRCEICMQRFGWKQVLKEHLNNIHTKIST